MFGPANFGPSFGKTFAGIGPTNDKFVASELEEQYLSQEGIVQTGLVRQPSKNGGVASQRKKVRHFLGMEIP